MKHTMKQTKEFFNKSIKAIKKNWLLFPVGGNFKKNETVDNQVANPVCDSKPFDNSDTENTRQTQPNRLWKRKQLTDYENYIRRQDWYYQHSWFEKDYFIQKLKRKLMNTVFRFTKKALDKFFDLTCDKFFIQFKFGIEEDVYVDLPLIIYADGIKDAQNIVGEINSYLNSFKFKVIVVPELREISNNDVIELEKQILSKYTKDDIIGEMEIFTMRRGGVKLKYKENVVETDKYGLAGYHSKDRQIVNFKVITSNSKVKPLLQNEKYDIFVKLSKDEPIAPMTLEEINERMRKTMFFKQGE